MSAEQQVGKSGDAMPRQYAPRYRTAGGAPGRKCRCGHREGTHNDLGYCTVTWCDCCPPTWPSEPIPGKRYGFEAASDDR